MWQNLPPKVGRIAEEATSIVAHNLLASELMGDWKSLMSEVQAGNTTDDEENVDTTKNDKVQWMVFKVKQRAKTNYYDALTGKEEEAQSVAIPEFTHNWPYDFFSLVELAKMEASIEFIPSIQADLSLISDAGNTNQAAPPPGAAAIPPGGFGGDD